MIKLFSKKKKRGPFFSTSGLGWRLAYALEALADDFDTWLPEGAKWTDPSGVSHEVYGPSERYVGTLGDARHKKEPSSDHNPFIRRNGKGVVRAIDVNFGNQDLNDYVRDQLSRKYWEKDSRLWSRGYAKSNYFITANASHGGGLHNLTRHCDPGDPGHVHVSVTRDGDLGYDPAIDSRAGWGFAKPVAKPVPHVPTHAAPKPAPVKPTAPKPAPAKPAPVVTPTPAPPNLLEQIMALDRTSDEYKNFVNDIAVKTAKYICDDDNGNPRRLLSYLKRIPGYNTTGLLEHTHK